MLKLTDTQLVILSAAAARESLAVLPLPKSLNANKGSAASVLKALLKKGLVEEVVAKLNIEPWRIDNNGSKFALVITDAGLAALDGKAEGPPPKQPQARQGGAGKRTPPSGKAGIILGLLNRQNGARMAELRKATGWQAHSVRAAITGLRKRGIPITRSQDNGVTVYRAVEG
jgi:DNA-binding MarR family transcriptional regulator